MSQRTDGPTSTGRRRTPAPPVKKPFPWGTVAISSVLGVLLAGILFYAATNQGSGFVDPIKAADSGIEGVKVTKKFAKTDHVEGKVDYGTTQPPAGGQMNGSTVPCKVYPEPVVTEQVVHSMEHGGTWVSYRPDLPKSDIEKITGEVGGKRNVLVSPFPGQTAPVSLQAWGRQLTVTSASDPRIAKFIDAYAGGSQAPEGKAGC